MLLLITEQKRNWKCICFKNVDFPPNLLTLALCGFGNFILTVALAKDKKEQKRGTVGVGGSYLQCFIRCIYSFLCSYFFKSCERVRKGQNDVQLIDGKSSELFIVASKVTDTEIFLST